jgi:hypothetical protein
MKRELFMSIMTVAVLGAATPALADRGHGQGNAHWKNHHHGQFYRNYERHVYYYYPSAHVRKRHNQHDYAYIYAPRAPGIHVVLPNVYIPLR